MKNRFAAAKVSVKREASTTTPRIMRIVLCIFVVWAAAFLFMAIETFRFEETIERARLAGAERRRLSEKAQSISRTAEAYEVDFVEIEKRLRLKDAKARAWDRLMTLVDMRDYRVKRGKDRFRGKPGMTKKKEER